MQHPIMESLQEGSQTPRNNEEENKRVQEEQMRRDVMATVLETAARERRAFLSLSVYLGKSWYLTFASVEDRACQSRKSQKN